MGRSGGKKQQNLASSRSKILGPSSVNIQTTRPLTIKGVDALLSEIKDRKERSNGVKFTFSADFSDTDLCDLDLSGIKFTETSFENASAESISFAGEGGSSPSSFIATKLENAYFRQSDFSGVEFVGARMNGIKIQHSNFKETSFNGSDMFGVELSCCFFKDLPKNAFGGVYLAASVDFWGSTFVNCSEPFPDSMTLDGIVFRSAQFENFEFAHKQKLRGSDFFDAKLDSVVAINADFSNSSFTTGKIENSNLSFSKFSDAELSFLETKASTFHGCVFSGANMQDVEFTDTNMSHTTFRNTDIANAIFVNCDFRKSDIKSAPGFDSARFENCQFDS